MSRNIKPAAARAGRNTRACSKTSTTSRQKQRQRQSSAKPIVPEAPRHCSRSAIMDGQQTLAIMENPIPTIGAPAPEFTLKDQDQKEVNPSDFRGKKRVVLIFYPLDWSPTCTKEHACMINDKKQFEDLDAEVLGISVDSVWL